jgi:L-ascorbate metabolism protein UlaG (beta-lactamase superfamily)
MKISKHLHSCLFVQDKGKTFLIDPGIFTFQEKALTTESIDKLDYILITHEHPDHFYLPFVKEIVAKFPDVKIITNKSLVEQLKKEHITASNEDDSIVTLESVPHEKLWDGEPPENVMITVFGKLASPGDSHHFETAAEIIALPLIAPWGSTSDAIALALKLKPKVIVPIHDWMYKEGVRQMMYTRLTDFFKTKSIAFKAVETGEIFEV